MPEPKVSIEEMISRIRCSDLNLNPSARKMIVAHILAAEKEIADLIAAHSTMRNTLNAIAAIVGVGDLVALVAELRAMTGRLAGYARHGVVCPANQDSCIMEDCPHCICSLRELFAEMGLTVPQSSTETSPLKTGSEVRKPLDYWARVIDSAIEELNLLSGDNPPRGRSVMPLTATLVTIAMHIRNGSVMPIPQLSELDTDGPEAFSRAVAAVGDTEQFGGSDFDEPRPPFPDWTRE